MKPCPDISIIIPALNNAALSEQVLADVHRTLEPGLEVEIIFIDDGSTDHTESVARAYADVTYIKHPENRGVPYAWNTGVAAARGDFVCVLNNDVRITDPAWMSKMINAARGGKKIVGVELVDYNRASEYNGKIIPYLNGWLFLVPRRTFYEIGMFEERFAPASFEDVDLCTRAQFAGYKLAIVDDIRAQHAYSKTVSKFIGSAMPGINQRNRDLWLAKMRDMDRPRLKIVFDCPGNMAGGWGPRSLEDRGLGGAETAITLLTRELATRGHEVLIYNDLPATETGDGVTYHSRSLLPATGLECDVFVTFRCPSEYITQTSAKKKVFWSCDQQTSGNWERDIFPHVDTVVCISDYHAAYLQRRFGLSAERFQVIGCPVNSWDYEPHPHKVDGRFIFCSVPHRGLEFMPMVMREIRKELPEAELVITSDYRLWGAPDPRNGEFRPMFHPPLDQFLGKVDRADLLEYQRTAHAQPYPCTYEECFCIATAECQAAGATPVTTDIGAVAQTVGAAGYIVGPPTGDFAQRIARQTLDIYGNPDVQRNAIQQSWRWSSVTIGNRWEALCYDRLPVDHELTTPPNYIPSAQLDFGTYTLPDGTVVSSRGNG